MAYATLEDLVSRFGERELVQLTDDADLGVADADRVTVALTDASETVNAYVAGRYAVPLAPVPDLVRRWTCDIARYLLHRETPDDSAVSRNNAAALAGLKDVAKGLSSLEAAGIPTAASPADDGGDLALVSGAAPVMITVDWGL